MEVIAAAWRAASMLMILAAEVTSVALAQPCASFNCGSQQKLPVRQGPNFNHVLPAGWSVVEEGQYALLLRSRDASAGIFNFGLSGLLHPMDPQALAYDIITNRLRLTSDLRVLDRTPIRPLPPYTSAAILDVSYSLGAERLRGVVFSNVANVYNRTDGMITLIAAKQRVWPAYVDWLPPLAMLVINTGPDPYGRHSTSQAILKDTQRLNQLASQYRDWSWRTWNDLEQFRAGIQARQQQELGPTLTGQQWYNNPYGGPPVRQSTAPAVIWINRNGDLLPSDNPTFDPRSSTSRPRAERTDRPRPRRRASLPRSRHR
jgi:hypothetical protein